MDEEEEEEEEEVEDTVDEKRRGWGGGETKLGWIGERKRGRSSDGRTRRGKTDISIINEMLGSGRHVRRMREIANRLCGRRR